MECFFRKVNLGPSYGPDRVREQVKVQFQGSGKMKTWGVSQNQGVKILNSQKTTCPHKERFRRSFVTERKRQWEVRESTPSPEEDLQ